MNFKIVISIIILIVVVFIFLNRKNFDKYLKPIGRIILLATLIIIFLACISAIVTPIYRNSIGNLFTDYAETNSSPNQSGSDDTLIITVSLDQITINL